MESKEKVQAVAGLGLEGDRYFDGTGHWSKTSGVSREVTLIEIETVEALEHDHAALRERERRLIADVEEPAERGLGHAEPEGASIHVPAFDALDYISGRRPEAL